MSLIGAHVSIKDGIAKSPYHAQKQGCEVMQIFLQSPQTFKTPETTPQEVEAFKRALKKHHIKEVYVHTPYLINLASPNNRIKYGSISLIRKNLERASSLGCKYAMTHLGSYGNKSQKDGLAEVVKSLTKILDGYTGRAVLLLEFAAGSGNIIGSRFEEIHKILTALKKYELGICFDTAHVFASGYDLRGKKKIDATLKQFDEIIGLDKIKLIHINDSLAPFGSKKDRHADIGDGEIGIENLGLFINNSNFKAVNIILETPGSDRRRKQDIALLKKIQCRI